MLEIKDIFSRFSAFGFSGSRSGVSTSVLSSVASLVPPGSAVFVGCARGVDAYFRACFPSAQVFSVSSSRWGSGRGAYAGRSIAVVRAVAQSRGLWVSFPSSPCPPGLVPSASSSRCFYGSGSGTYASLALALGLGVPCVVFSSCGVPAGWGAEGTGQRTAGTEFRLPPGLSPVPGCSGWFGCPVVLGSAPAAVQLSLF
jgi:hypothetical protein